MVSSGVTSPVPITSARDEFSITSWMCWNTSLPVITPSPSASAPAGSSSTIRRHPVPDRPSARIIPASLMSTARVSVQPCGFATRSSSRRTPAGVQITARCTPSGRSIAAGICAMCTGSPITSARPTATPDEFTPSASA
ncbi:MAG: hypothetical protein EA378_02685 [Phycisphaerales bacterium]|nr:MAG: hypothetical protein EA378_02685 [Phycisphaerales bacterium]